MAILAEEMGQPVPAGERSGGWLARLWHRPEAELSDIAFRGELLVAGVRLFVLLILLYFPFRIYLPRLLGAWRDEAALGEIAGPLTAILAAAAFALSGALVIYAAVQRQRGRAWIGFASALFDVTVVSGALLFFHFAGPRGATGDLALFPLYFLALGATALRYDSRICWLAGVLATVQYAGLVALETAPRALGTFDLWATQGGRLAQLALATVLFTVVVVRSRELRLLATHDLLTGLSNRAIFDERLVREVATARRGFAVAMVDIDHFKRFNDTHGHATGDQALRSVAQALRQACRETDVVARYGGEEFSLILPGVRSHRAQHLLERIRSAVAITPIQVIGRRGMVAVTVSIGIASWPEDGRSPTEVLAAADRRLYEAKQRGRDLVVGPPPPTARPLTHDEVMELEETSIALRPPGM
jgi:diguanylate cyclase (GGDEF)-like protein